VQDLMLGRVEVFAGAGGGPPEVILSGAFNPWHAGHRRMAEVAHELWVSRRRWNCRSSTPISAAGLYGISALGAVPSRTGGISYQGGDFSDKSRLLAGATFWWALIRFSASLARYHGGNLLAHQFASATRRPRLRSWFLAATWHGFLRPGDLDLPEPLRACSAKCLRRYS